MNVHSNQKNKEESMLRRSLSFLFWPYSLQEGFCEGGNEEDAEFILSASITLAILIILGFVEIILIMLSSISAFTGFENGHLLVISVIWLYYITGAGAKGIASKLLN